MFLPRKPTDTQKCQRFLAKNVRGMKAHQFDNIEGIKKKTKAAIYKDYYKKYFE